MTVGFALVTLRKALMTIKAPNKKYQAVRFAHNKRHQIESAFNGT
jgi:hypothetical protein